MLRFSHFHLFDITEEEISGEALLAIEKNYIKEIGVKPMGRRIQLMAKMSLKVLDMDSSFALLAQSASFFWCGFSHLELSASISYW